MASYFELPAQSNAPAAPDLPKEEQELRGTGMLTPKVSRILDDLKLNDKSSSSDEGEEEENSSGSESDEGSRISDDDTKIDDSLSRESRQAPSGTANTVHGSKTTTKSGIKGIKSSGSATGGDKHLKNPRSHMARFQSLRSTLFQANIENNMKKCHEEAEAREKAATYWKSQHEKRQGYNRPHTPEKVPNEKDGFGRRIGMKIRRLTSKEPPTLANIEENTGNLTRRESTATDDEDEPHGDPWKPRQSYESSINHSDVDELVRWVSRRDPPSDGEQRLSSVEVPKKEDSGHESLGHSDIEELVRHASRKSMAIKPVAPMMHTGYSDESTASDSELSQEEDDQEVGSNEGSLSRWVSRRDGAMAGPVRTQRSAPQIEPDTGSDSDVPEIGRWRTHHDDTSGESINGSAGSGIARKDDVSVLEAARGRSRERSPKLQDKGHLKNDDIDELVRWVSRRDSKQASNPDVKDDLAQLKHQEEEKTQKLGMTIEDKSLDHDDLDDLLAHVRGRQMSELNSRITPAHV
ncbi:hypothetical protein E8E12_010217 [Didymella heteroderae]|uniref:Uncharacterized protein n=1 Tax=Didymella heteroderae TaxID=1769908 RepID=A0A9P4WX99_9PLEO|nr:hypothetical protein E8E12_010217 [Didymella heteroderae]